MKLIGNVADKERGRLLNNRAQNSHQPFQKREGDGENKGRKDAAEIRLCPRPDPQSF
jgi:hypothetical protein